MSGSFERGAFAPAGVVPNVPRGRARVRSIVTADHTSQPLDEALEMFAEAGAAAGVP